MMTEGEPDVRDGEIHSSEAEYLHTLDFSPSRVLMIATSITDVC